MDRNHQPTRILTIDDNPAIHDDFRKILVAADHRHELNEAAARFFGTSEVTSPSGINAELDSALQGKEGYELVKTAVKDGRPYTLAFCDMRMPPGWDGLTTIEKLWEADPNLQVVICSAYSDQTWADISNRLGQSDKLLILKKPFDNAEVLQISVALIEKRRLADAARSKTEELEKAVVDRTRKLAAAREDSERLIDAIDRVLIQVDQDNIVRRFNHHAVNLFRISPHQALGVHYRDLRINWDEKNEVRDMVLDSRMNTSRRIVTQLTQPSGDTRIINVSIYPICENEDLQGKLILASDMTEPLLLEQQLNEAQKLESVGQLAAGVAHEINTPMQYLSDNLHFINTKFDKLNQYLTASQNLIELAQQGKLSSESLDEIERISQQLKLEKLTKQIPEALRDSVEGVDHVAKIVKAMKELSHPGGDEMTPVDLNKSLRSTVTVSTNEWKYVAETELQLAEELPMVMGFPGELSQVFLNLIINAAQAIREVNNCGIDGKGKIIIRTIEQDDHVLVEIEDNGGGIPSSIRGRIFDPFFTTKEIGVGTGQGLAIAHNVIVQKHAGDLSFEVLENVGTTFRVLLPIEANTSSNFQANEKLLVS